MTPAPALVQKLALAGLQSGSIMGMADIVTQTAIERRPEVDVRRTAQWAVAGLSIHGPYFFLGFRRLDQYFGAATSLKIVAYKTATAQFILFPPYLVALFAYLGFLERYGHYDNSMSNAGQAVFDKVGQCVPAAFVGGCVFWPVANVLNFGFVPGGLRVPYIAASAGVWNSYLSWANARARKA